MCLHVTFCANHAVMCVLYVFYRCTHVDALNFVSNYKYSIISYPSIGSGVMLSRLILSETSPSIYESYVQVIYMASYRQSVTCT